MSREASLDARARRLTTFIAPIVNLALAAFAAAVVVMVIGEDPVEVLELLAYGAFGYSEGVGYTLFYATNFIFTGLAFALAFQAGLFNIGAEGQATLGGLGVAVVCLNLDFLPSVVLAPLAILGAGGFGALWAMGPGWLQAHRGSHIVITTIMFNFLASALLVYLLVNLLSPPGSMQPETRTFVESARLANLKAIGLDFGYSPVNLSLFFALIASALVWALLWRTKLGYELRTLGANPTAAVYAGMRPKRLTVIAMAISGALAGCLALNEIMGSQNRLILDFTAGYGFAGIAVALMGRSHPIGVILAAILFGALYQGGAELAFEKPAITRDLVVVIQGLVVFFSGALEHAFRPSIERFLRSLLARRGDARSTGATPTGGA